ncbi:nitrate- and nitrite sensing domain-containing protein [Streptomyces celluloflavus]|uniref:nitrate- and nitrite sensing domain-containing protein n=1 Tax=Streptomyces celluloflavus TaxID=58344 RepID=UPI0036BC7AC0
MTVVLALPVALALGLAVPRVTHSLDRAERLAGDGTTVRLVLSATRLAHALQNERDLAARTPGRTTDGVRTHRAATDRAPADFRTRADPAANAARAVDGSRPTTRLSAAERALGTLAELRAKAFTAAAGPVATQTAYDDLVAPLPALGTEAGHGDDPAATPGWALHALSTGTAALSDERALLNAALADGRPGAEEAAVVLAAQGVQERALREFRAAAAPADVALLEKPAASTAAARTMAGRAVAAAQRSPRDAELPLRAPEWHRTAGQALDRHGIRVRLRCTGGGCTAVMELPATLFAEPGGDTAHQPDTRAGRDRAAPAPEPAPPPRPAPPPAATASPPPEAAASPPPAAANFPPPGAALPRRVPRPPPPDTPPAAYDPSTAGTAPRAPQPRPTPDELRRRIDGFHGGARRGRRAPGTPPDDRTTGHGDGRPGSRSGTPTGGARGTRRRAREPGSGGDGYGTGAGEPDRGGSPDRNRREEG